MKWRSHHFPNTCHCEERSDEAIFPQASVIARNEVTKQSFTILSDNSFTSMRTDCFAPIKNRGSQWLVISGYSHCEEWNDGAIFPQASVIARNEVTKQSFTILSDNSFTSMRTDCFAPIKNRGSQWLVISGYSHCEEWNDEAIFPQASVIARNEMTKQSFHWYTTAFQSVT